MLEGEAQLQRMAHFSAFSNAVRLELDGSPGLDLGAANATASIRELADVLCAAFEHLQSENEHLRGMVQSGRPPLSKHMGEARRSGAAECDDGGGAAADNCGSLSTAPVVDDQAAAGHCGSDVESSNSGVSMGLLKNPSNRVGFRTQASHEHCHGAPPQCQVGKTIAGAFYDDGRKGNDLAFCNDAGEATARAVRLVVPASANIGEGGNAGMACWQEDSEVPPARSCRSRDVALHATLPNEDDFSKDGEPLSARQSSWTEDSSNRSANISESFHKMLMGGSNRNTVVRSPTALAAKKESYLRQIVQSGFFEAASAALIVLYAALFALELQHNGIESGYALGIHGYTKRKVDSVAFFSLIFTPLAWAFDIVFLAEVVVRIVGEGRQFVRSRWNMFDLIVVAASWMDVLQASATTRLNPMVIRVMRVLRLVRLCKKLKHVQVFDSARVLAGSMEACVPIFCWTLVALFFAQSFLAFLFVDFLAEYINDDSNPLSTREQLYRYFGTWSRALLTTSELTMGNWAPPMRLLTNNVHEAYGHSIIAYRMVVGFAMIRVIGGVFLHETFSVASADDDLMVMQKARSQAKHVAKMKKFLSCADGGKDGTVSLEEFAEVLTVPEMRVWFAAQDLEVSDADLLFQLLDDDNNGYLSIDELTVGVARLKGAARSIHLHALMHIVGRLGHSLTDLDKKVDGLNVMPTSGHDGDASMRASREDRNIVTNDVFDGSSNSSGSETAPSGILSL
eukprot:NODE_1113_length_2601_cov_10.129749.p1 GENE.NODE_1113_length_2601_cov_10.129749~~NODE_1113_length_2601_cov_10.129749.p1  ORF type:complete len:764 (-),score=143.03 NODE_1113_length_2601_cov_10.129749:310-2523(-)